MDVVAALPFTLLFLLVAWWFGYISILLPAVRLTKFLRMSDLMTSIS